MRNCRMKLQSCKEMVVSSDGVTQSADPLHFADDLISRPQKAGRIKAHADPRRSSGCNDCPRQQGHPLGKLADRSRDSMNLKVCVRQSAYTPECLGIPKCPCIRRGMCVSRLANARFRVPLPYAMPLIEQQAPAVCVMPVRRSGQTCSRCKVITLPEINGAGLPFRALACPFRRRLLIQLVLSLIHI